MCALFVHVWWWWGAWWPSTHPPMLVAKEVESHAGAFSILHNLLQTPAHQPANIRRVGGWWWWVGGAGGCSPCGAPSPHPPRQQQHNTQHHRVPPPPCRAVPCRAGGRRVSSCGAARLEGTNVREIQTQTRGNFLEKDKKLWKVVESFSLQLARAVGDKKQSDRDRWGE